jgi:ElaB/YqjD/DUF883 family membrane-anchored ribosome-binding protein
VAIHVSILFRNYYFAALPYRLEVAPRYFPTPQPDARLDPHQQEKENVMYENEKGSLFGKAVHVGERVMGVGAEAARLKVRAAHAVEDTMVEARRLAKKGRYAAEDMVDDAAYRIKRDPLRSVAITFAIGLAIGALTGWLAGRNERS